MRLRIAAPRLTSLVVLVSLGVCGCSTSPSSAQRQVIAGEIEREVRGAYDLSSPGVEQRLLSLYPDTGRIVSASMGHLLMNRDTIFGGIRYFWRAIGVN